MWKRACVCAILAAVLPQGVTWAAYGDVISNVPTPPAVTETAKPAAAASKPATAAPKSVAVSQPAAAVPKSVAVAPATKPAKTPVSVTPGPAAPPVKPEPVTPKPITPSPAVTAKPAPQVPVPAAPKPGLVPETKPASVPAPKVSTTTPKAVVPAPKVTAPAPKETVPSVTARVPVKPALPSVTAKTTAPKTARAKKTRRETKKPATQYKAVYEVGDSGWKVREAQRKLRLLGYEVEDQQGHFTKEMSRQLKKFQRHAKLKADGKLDEKTYEALGWGYGPSAGEGWDKVVSIISRASGAPVIANALALNARAAKNGLPKIVQEEIAKAKKAGLDEILETLQPKPAQAEEEVKAPAKEPTDDELHGIDVLEIENAVKCLWKAGIYAESSMGCTGPVVKMAAHNMDKAREVLKDNGYL